MTSLDKIEATGTNNKLALAVLDEDDSLPIFNMSGVQTVNIRSAEGIGQTGAKGLDFSQTGVVGLQTVNVTEAYGDVTLTVGGATAVNVSGLDDGNAVDVTAKTGAVTVTATGDVTIEGGSTQTITTEGDVASSKATGNVSVTNGDQTGAAVEVMDGANVTVVTSYDADDTDEQWDGETVSVGINDAWDAAGEVTGAIDVTVNVAGSKTADTYMDGVTIYGGSSVDVTFNATQAINAATNAGAANRTVQQSYIGVFGTEDTKTVSVTQTEAVDAANSRNAIADVAEVDKLTFKALASGANVEVAGLKLTASVAMTAAEVAAAFANLEDGASHGSSTKGIYSGKLEGWSSGSASTTAVNFTSTAYAATNIDADNGTDASDPTVTEVTNGVAGQKAIAGVGGIATEWVDVGGYDVDDDEYFAADAIETVNLTNFSGTWIASKVLSDVNLVNGGEWDIDINSGLEEVNVTVDNVKGDMYFNYTDDGDRDYDSAIKTVNLTVTGEDSELAIDGDDAVDVTSLNIDGDAALDLTGSDLSSLTTVTISGTVSVVADDAFAAASVTSVVSTTSGDVSADINGRYASYTGGSGVDEISLSTDSRYLNNVSLGGDDDTLTLVNDTDAVLNKNSIGTGVILDGGAGTNTLSMDAADADNISATDLTKIFAGKLKNFAVLDIAAVDGGDYTVDLDYLTNTTNKVLLNSHVVTNGVAGGDSLYLENLISGGTVEAKSYTDWLDITVVDAATKDVSLNLAVTGDDDFYFGADGVETINVTSTDGSGTGVDENLVDLYDGLDDLTTVNLSGDADVVLSIDSTALALVDASDLSGALIFSTSIDEIVIIGGSGDDEFSISGDNSIVNGGEGDDIFDVNDDAMLVELTGGAGNDTFVINDGINIDDADAYAPTIMDAQSGDMIRFENDLNLFVNTAFESDDDLTLAGNIEAVTEALDADTAGWFVFDGDTYIVADTEGGTDAIIVHMIGEVDLSNASFSTTQGTLMIA